MPRYRHSQLNLDLEEESPTARDPETSTPRRGRAKPEESGGWRRRARRIFIWTGTGVVLIGAALGAYQVDQFLASDAHFILRDITDAAGHPYFTLEGVTYAPREEVTRVFAHDFGRSIYLMPITKRRQSLMAIDWVREASVSRIWPNRVTARVVERAPVAFVTLPRRPGAGGEIFDTALIDADGVILRLPGRARFSLPVMSGITRDESAATRRQRVQEVVALLKEVQSYAAQISEIDVSDPANLTITGTAQGRVIRLLLGNRNYLSRLSNFMSHYSEISRRLPDARTFDLRLDDHITAEDGAPNGR
jgi:cell division protein FtsQ